MKSGFVFEKNRVARYILIVTLFILLMVNWNSYRMYQVIDRWNPVNLSIVLTLVLFLVSDIKKLIKDKFFLIVVFINVLAIVNMTIVGTGYYEMFSLYCLTLGIYLSGKLVFRRREVLIMSAFIAFFFFYWTVDVKGYYKGYSINYGGLVLITGFIFTLFILEYFRYQILHERYKAALFHFIKEHPYIITAVEILMFLVAYSIISWYRSRTAFFSLIVLAILMICPRKLLGNKVIFRVITYGTLIGGFIFPIIYVYIGNRVNAIDYQMFYKSLFDSRLPVWQDLFNIYKNYIFTGIGTIYTSNELYRPGLLDTMNAYVNLLIVYGPIVCILVLALIGRAVLVTRENVENSHFGKTVFAGTIVMLVASYAESMIVTVPFTLIFVLTLSITRSICSDESFGDVSEYQSIDYEKYTKKLKGPSGIKIITTIVSVALPVFLVYILGPVEVYYANYDEFSFTNNDYLWMFLSLAIIIIFTAITVILILPDKLNIIAVSILTAISTASYVQYMFLNKKLIMEDGEFVDAATLGNYPVITLSIYAAVFIVVCAVLYFCKNNRYHVAAGISGFILIVTCIAALSLFLTHIGSKKERLWYSGADEFKVAPHDNIIVIVPDTFGREALDSMLDEYPESIDFLHDFTFYEKEDSEYFPTYPALHHMLTGYPYDESMTRFEYTKEAFESDSAKEFYGELHEKGYTVRFFTRDILFERVTEGLVDNIEEAHITIDRKSLFKYLYKMSMYRYVPYVLKAWYQVDSMDIENINQYNGVGPYFLNSEFYSAMQEQGITIDDTIENAFILAHIRGPHMPYMSNANNELVPDNSVSGDEASYGTMRLIEDYINRLKLIDKYDDSTIIIVADHGFYNTDSIFFVKEKNESHLKLIVSDEPIKHSDFQEFVRKIQNW